jgi:hypothetical protein
MKKASGTIDLASWEENPYAERDGEKKLTRASVTQTVAGDISGTGKVEWLMCYQDDGTARFVGLQQIDGTIDGLTGSVVLESNGEFDGKLAKGTWNIIPGSGSGEWTGMTGHGQYSAPHGPTAEFTLEYEIA